MLMVLQEKHDTLKINYSERFTVWPDTWIVPSRLIRNRTCIIYWRDLGNDISLQEEYAVSPSLCGLETGMLSRGNMEFIFVTAVSKLLEFLFEYLCSSCSIKKRLQSLSAACWLDGLRCSRSGVLTSAMNDVISSWYFLQRRGVAILTSFPFLPS